MATKHPPQEGYSDHPSSPTPPQGRPVGGSEPSSGRAEAPDRVGDESVGDNTRKPPEDWKTGDEPMTGAQRSYLRTLSDEAHVPFDEHLTKAEASRRIDELQQVTGRGKGGAAAGNPADAPGGGARGSRQHPDAGGQAEADGQSASLRGVSDRGGR